MLSEFNEYTLELDLAREDKIMCRGANIPSTMWGGHHRHQNGHHHCQEDHQGKDQGVAFTIHHWRKHLMILKSQGFQQFQWDQLNC